MNYISGDNLTAKEIKILLIKKNIKQIDLAKKLKVTPGMIHGLIVRKFKSKRLKSEIAALLNMDVNELWGDGE